MKITPLTSEITGGGAYLKADVVMRSS